MKRLLIIVLSALFCTGPFAEDTVLFNKVIDWQKSAITVYTHYDFDAPFKPPLRLKAQRELEKEFPGILKSALLDLTIDSYFTVLDAVLLDASKLNDIERLYAAASLEQSVLSNDFSSMMNTYTLDFHPSLMQIFTDHSTPEPIRPVMEPTVSGNFSGILIYAKGMYEVYGENSTDSVEPCLFPKLRNYKSEIILEASNLNKNDILEYGIVYYSGSLDDPAVIDRVGLVPLRVQASKIFGKHRTDIIFSETDTYRLLSNESIIKLLTTGRIAIILDLP